MTDPAQRQALVALCGQQAYVAEAPEFLVFCADFYRHSRIVPEALTGFAEQLLIGAIDGALMGQNALLAAESLGLGGVFIGAIRNQPDEVTTLLGLPKLVIPLFGLCLGHPAREPALKPRLPAELVVHENRYQTEPDPALLAGYDAHMQDYYAHRGSNQKAESWSSQITRILVITSYSIHYTKLYEQKGQLTGQFRDFALWAAQRKGLILPEGLDYAAFEAGGAQRLPVVARMERNNFV